MFTRFKQGYRRLFALDEIESDSVLQALHFVLLVGFFISFAAWLPANVATVNAVNNAKHTCLPFFQNCESLYIWNALPWSYDQSIWYAFLSSLLCLSGIFAFKKKWAWAHSFLILPFFWKLFYITVLTHSASVDFEYFHLPYVFIYLFVHRKLYFLRRVLSVLYLMAATMKFNESWVVGSYFSSLKLGMPLFADALIPYISNGIALFEIVTPWLLLSTRKSIRYPIISLWVVFHLYSIILVKFSYPAYCLPVLVVLFLSDFSEKDQQPSFTRKSWMGWAFLGLILALSSVPHFMTGNRLYTLQAIKFGVGMFDANHQCVSDSTSFYKDGTSTHDIYQSQAAMKRCTPYEQFFQIKQWCKNEDITSVTWKFASSVNGGAFYQIVDVANACKLEYLPFSQNKWIQLPEDGAPIVGYPDKNIIQKKTYTKKNIIFPEQRIFLSATQEWLSRNQQSIIFLLWVLWFGTGFYFIARRLRKLKTPTNA